MSVVVINRLHENRHLGRSRHLSDLIMKLLCQLRLICLSWQKMGLVCFDSFGMAHGQYEQSRLVKIAKLKTRQFTLMHAYTWR